MFQGKTAFITGAGSGIGRALAVTLAQRGCALSLTDIDEAGLQETADQVQRHNVGLRTGRLDVSDRAAVEQAVNDTVDEFGTLDLIFNNAGVALTDPVDQLEYDDFEWLMNINFWGVVHGTKAALPHMQKQNSGHIINISSLFGLIGVPTQSAYCAAKFAVRGFTESLVAELKFSDSNVTAHSVHPGGVATSIAKSGRFRNDMAGTGTKEQSLKNAERMLTLPPEKAAEIILDGVRTNNPRILVGSDAKRLDFFQRLMPRKVTDMLVKMSKKNRE